MKITTFSRTCIRAAAALLGIMGCLQSSVATATEYEVTNTSSSAATSGSLPWAVAQVNAGAGSGDLIKFNIPGTGPFTISLTSQLTLSKKACVDGTTQPGYSSSPLIVISGNGTVANGLTVGASYSTVKGLAINGCTNDGIRLAGNFDTVSLCYVGTDASGTVAVPNQYGIEFAGTGTLIGGIGTGNVISGNTAIGINIYAGRKQFIVGNYVGLDATGTTALPNGTRGISMATTADSNIIGGTDAGAGNVVSGNLQRGISLNSKHNIVQGNILGMNATGTQALVNGQTAIYIDADSNYVGGSTTATRNYIVSSSNGLTVNKGRGNKVVGNYIGLSMAGNAALTTAGGGITVSTAATETSIGGASAGEGNVIGSLGSTGSAIALSAPARVQGNIIGLDPGLTIAMPMGTAISISVAASGSIIGGTGIGEANTIANCTKSITISSSSTNNVINGNSIYNNGRGIDFGDNGVTLNDIPDVNGVLNFPVITSVAQDAGNTTVEGTYDGIASSSVTVELFSNDSFYSGGYGQGKTYLGNTIVTTDASGHGTFSVTFPGKLNFISSTASAAGYNTSEFSRTVSTGQYEVINTSNNAATIGSLPWAVAQVNAGAGTGDVIRFNIPGTGPFTIALASALTLNKKAFIDGTTQPGYTSSPQIAISGGGSVSRFVNITANNSAIKGLAVNGFTSEGIRLSSNFDTVSLCYIGIDASGTTAVANNIGIFVNSNNCTIGGPGAGNVISGNTGNGLQVNNNGSNQVQGNYIGLTADGNSMLPNAGNGISIATSAAGNIIGGTVPGAGNVISGNGNSAIILNSKKNTLQGNIIGMNATGTDTLVNRAVSFSNRGGVFISNDSNMIGGSAPGARNYITTDYVGLAINAGKGNIIQGNYIGLNKAGTQAFTPQNMVAGIVAGGFNSLVGGSGAGEGNVIAGSQVPWGHGIGLPNVSAVVYGNIVGFDPTLTIPMGLGVGINFDGDSTTVGGTGNGEGNIVANNGKGIVVRAAATTWKISGNSVYDNGIGIDYGYNNVTRNDIPDLDGLSNFPVIMSIIQAAGNTTISGIYDGKISSSVYIEFFNNDVFVTNGHGQGKTYIGNTTVTTDASGHATFSVTFPGTFNIVSSTATASGFNTSEFSRTGPSFTNTAPTLNVCKNDNAKDISQQVHALAPQIGATLTWQAAGQPAHGSLVVTAATAASGGSDIAPSGTLTYKPAPGYTGPDQFKVRITDSKFPDTVIVAVTVHDPVVTATNDGPVCDGRTINVNSSVTGLAPAYSYEWSGPNSFTSTTEDNTLPGIALSAGGVYTVIVTDSYGCKDTGSTSVSIYPRPAINAIGNNGPVCIGMALQLNGAATGGTGTLAYSWSGPNSFSQTGDTQEISSATTAAAGTYTVIVKDINNCADTSTTTAVVNTLPAITAIGTSGAVCENNPLSLFSSVSGGAGTYTYAWTGPNSFSSTDEDPLVASSATTAASGTYELTVTDDNNCVATGTNTTAVNIYGRQPITGKDSVLFGTTIALSNSVAGGTWSTPTPWKTGVTPATGVVKGVSAGISEVSYTTGNGCVSTHSVTVLMGNNVCVGQTTTLTDALVGGTWTSNYSSIASVSLTTGIVKGIAAGRAVITHRTSTGMITTTITVNALSTTSSLSGVCQGQTLTLTNNTPGGGTWYSGNTAVATVSASGLATGTEGGTATIYFTPHAGCATERVITVIPVTPITGPATVCMGQTVNMGNSTPGGAWSTSAGALAQVNAAGVVKGMSAGTPRVSYIWPNGCQAVKTMTVNTLSQITGGTPGICASGSMTLTNSTPFGGVWSSSNTTAATVNPTTGFVKGTGAGSTVVLFTTNVGGCVATRTITVNACRESGEETTSVTEVAADDVRIYPNPNNGQFTLAGKLVATEDGELTVTVMNMLGQTIYSSSMQVQNGNVDKQITLTNDLANGTYILNLRTDNGNRQYRFVVNR